MKPATIEPTIPRMIVQRSRATNLGAEKTLFPFSGTIRIWYLPESRGHYVLGDYWRQPEQARLVVGLLDSNAVGRLNPPLR